jgi:pyruvate dehydrogenase E2 component (dihydrolipoamide acetyltransferase)
MAKPIVMPQMGYDMTEGTILRWLKREGDRVERGEPIAEIETDKVNLEIESFESGVLLKLVAQEGQTIPVGQPIAIVGEPGEQIEAAAAPAAAAADGKARRQEKAEQPVGAPAAQAAEAVAERAPGERVRASPLVRRLAAEHGIDLSQVRGSGPGGRIVKEDILPLIGRPAAAPAVPPAEVAAPAAPAAPVAPPRPEVEAPPAPVIPGLPEFELVDLSRMRQTIARRMAESHQQAPHFYVTTVVEMDAALALRKQINEQVDDEAEKVSITDMLVKACALALRKHRGLNASFAGTQLRVYKRIDIAIAVAVENGLITPYIVDADHKPLGQIARLSKDLINRARAGELRPEEYQGGTFTISNLGMYGLIEHFTAVINPPQAAILAVGSIIKEPVYRADGELVPSQRMRMTLSTDHRVADGVAAAQFLAEVKHLLEHPMLLLVR